jgi:hypothetical protein
MTDPAGDPRSGLRPVLSLSEDRRRRGQALVYPTTLHAVEDMAAWWSLDDLNAEVPDQHHDSTVDNLASSFDASDDLRCFHKEHVRVAEIQRWQLHDDPDAFESIAKIEEIRGAIRRGGLHGVLVGGVRFCRYTPLR